MLFQVDMAMRFGGSAGGMTFTPPELMASTFCWKPNPISGRCPLWVISGTYAVQNAMSALPPKADMCSALGDVRFVPIADIPTFIRSLRRAGEQWMNFEAKRLGRIEVDCFCDFLAKGDGL
jgi:hypothetical protein